MGCSLRVYEHQARIWIMLRGWWAKWGGAFFRGKVAWDHLTICFSLLHLQAGQPCVSYQEWPHEEVSDWGLHIWGSCLRGHILGSSLFQQKSETSGLMAGDHWTWALPMIPPSWRIGTPGHPLPFPGLSGIPRSPSPTVTSQRGELRTKLENRPSRDTS